MNAFACDHQADDVKKAVRGSLANYLAALLQLGVFVFHTLSSRLFGKAAYGAYVFAWSVIEIANKIAVAGFDKGVIRTVATEREKGDRQAELQALATTLRLVGMISSGVLAVLLLLAAPIADWQDVPVYASSIRALSPLVILWSGIVVLINATMATRTMRYNLLVRGIAEPLILVGALVGYAIFWPDGGGVAICFAHVTAFCCILLLAFRAFGRLFNAPRVLRRVFGKGADRDLIRFSIPVGIAELLNQAIYRTDVIMIGIFLADPLQVANYGACIMLSAAISSIRYAFDPILSPVVAQTVVSGNTVRLGNNLKMMVRWVTMYCLPLFLAMIIFGDLLLTLWGESYRVAYPALIVLAIAHLVNSVLGLHQWPVVMSGRSKLDLFNNAVAYAINLGLNLILIPVLGLVGAATATLAGNVVFRGMQVIQVWKIFRIHAFSVFWLRLLVAALAAAGVELGIRFIAGTPGWGWFLVATAAGMVTYLLVSAALGLAPEERAVLSRVLRRLSERRA